MKKLLFAILLLLSANVWAGNSVEDIGSVGDDNGKLTVFVSTKDGDKFVFLTASGFRGIRQVNVVMFRGHLEQLRKLLDEAEGKAKKE